MMGKYGTAAVNAVRTYTTGTAGSITDAWQLAMLEIFPNSVSSQVKGCPRGTFLGLCGSGRVTGIPPGEYTKSEKNKRYGLRALELLAAAPKLADDEALLWQQVMAGQIKVQNHQMDVVASLWKAGLLSSGAAADSY